MKTSRIRRANNRRHAASRRAIQAYWRARLVEARRWLAEAEEDLASAIADEYWGNLAQCPPNTYGYYWDIERAEKACSTYAAACRNASVRYQHACMASRY